MKKLLLLSATLLISSQAFAGTVERVQGKLTEKVVNNVVSQRIETKHGIINLSEIPEIAQGCHEGIFTIVPHRWGSNTYKIMNVDSCFKYDKPIYCTQQYQPVCGANETGMKSFPNLCFMDAAGYEIVHAGTCGNADF